MRFILVNRGKPKDPGSCTFCCTPMGQSYVRCLTTKCCYHNHFCLEFHIEATEQAMEGSHVAAYR